MAVGFVSVLLAAPLSGCKKPAPTPLPSAAYAKADTSTNDAERTQAAARLQFSDVAGEAGVDFHHENGAFGDKRMPETMNGGVCFLDFTNDGLPDLFFVNGGWWPGHEKPGPPPVSEFYVNQGGGMFEKSTEKHGLNFTHYGFGCAAGDYDNDGDADLFISGIGPNRLFRNDGARFTDVTGDSGVNRKDNEDEKEAAWKWSTAALWADFDRDGNLDLFYCNYVRWSPERDIFTTLDGKNKTYATPEQYEGDTCRLMGNRGDGTFEDRTRTAGLYQPDGKALGVAMTDVNDDGWIDLIVANDTQPNYLYVNQGDGSFSESGEASGVAYDRSGRAKAGMGVDAAYLEENPEPVVAVGNFSGETISFFQSRGGGSAFIDEAPRAGIAAPSKKTLTFGVLFFDADLDGRQDLIAANGHIEPTIQAIQKEIRFEQPMHLFHNLGNGKFQDVAGTSGEAPAKPHVARGVAAADMDLDGDLDVAVSINQGSALMLRNDTPDIGNAIQIQAALAAPARYAIGAKVIVKSKGLTQRFLVKTGSSYLSQSDPLLTVGLGRETSAQAEILWPDGKTETVDGLTAGHRYLLMPGRGVVHKIPFLKKH